MRRRQRRHRLCQLEGHRPRREPHADLQVASNVKPPREPEVASSAAQHRRNSHHSPTTVQQTLGRERLAEHLRPPRQLLPARQHAPGHDDQLSSGHFPSMMPSSQSPSLPGMSISLTTVSTSAEANRSSASSAHPASTTVYPWSSSASRANSRIIGSSSTTRTRWRFPDGITQEAAEPLAGSAPASKIAGARTRTAKAEKRTTFVFARNQSAKVPLRLKLAALRLAPGATHVFENIRA